MRMVVTSYPCEGKAARPVPESGPSPPWAGSDHRPRTMNARPAVSMNQRVVPPLVPLPLPLPVVPEPDEPVPLPIELPDDPLPVPDVEPLPVPVLPLFMPLPLPLRLRELLFVEPFMPLPDELPFFIEPPLPLRMPLEWPVVAPLAAPSFVPVLPERMEPPSGRC